MILKQAGLLESRRDGLNLYYRVVKPEIFKVVDALSSITGVSCEVAETQHANAGLSMPEMQLGRRLFRLSKFLFEERNKLCQHFTYRLTPPLHDEVILLVALRVEDTIPKPKTVIGEKTMSNNHPLLTYPATSIAPADVEFSIRRCVVPRDYADQRSTRLCWT